jgi:nucleoid-associated protein YgaU
MSNGIMIGSDCADWWEKHIKDFKDDLGDYVEKNPGYFSIAVATAGATVADLGDAFIIDTLRLGEGAAEGSLKGIVQDTFRVMSFIPPGRVLKVAAGAGRAGRAIEVAEAFRAVRGETCVPISIVQAIKTAGYKMAIGLAEVAKALGVDLATMTGASAEAIGPALEKLGILFEKVSNPVARTFEEVAALAKKAQSPVMMPLDALLMKDGKPLMKAGEAVHGYHFTLVAETKSGMRIIDRKGVFNSLEELGKAYNGSLFRVHKAAPYFVIKNALLDEALLDRVDKLGALGCLVVRTSGAVLDFNHSKMPAEFIKKDFANYLKQRGKTPPLNQQEILISGGKAVMVKPGDSLSAIAGREYKSEQLWPLIYDLNKEKIGPNPNRIQPGMNLMVLPINAYSPQEIAAAKQRAPSWKAFGA